MRHPAFRNDPHPLLRELREGTRVARDVLGIWLVLHHADVSAVLRSSQLSREIWRSPGYEQKRPFLADSTMERTTHQWMVFNDPPKHTRLRRLVGADAHRRRGNAALRGFGDHDDIGRQQSGHLAFGAGIHYCLGAPLARLEAEVAFTRLLQRYPHLELADASPSWHKLITAGLSAACTSAV